MRTLSLAAQSLRTRAVRGIERYLHFLPNKSSLIASDHFQMQKQLE